MLPLDEIQTFILEKTERNIEIFGDRLPTSTKDGVYQFADDGFWVGGFWTGLNLICYGWTGEKKFLQVARASRFRFVERLYEKSETLDHDIGFLYQLSSTADFKLTGDMEARQIALDAANQLAERYNHTGKFIRAWNVWPSAGEYGINNKGRIIIDCMYNLPLLFWAYEETGIERYRQIAENHAEVNRTTIVRSDYTTYHTYVFDPVTGEPRFGETHQGYADESCWSRGQSWAIGGYAHAYRHTGNQEFLETAIKVADVFLNELEEDGIPMWDFRLPTKQGEPRDTSAAAIAATGLLEIANHVTGSEKERYTSEAQRILKSLYENYTSQNNPEHQGLLLQACGNKPKGIDENCSLIYGDFYFAEAIARLSGSTGMFW